MIEFLVISCYLAIGFFCYIGDVFESDSANLIDLITYTLIGGVVLAIRVFRNGYAILENEVHDVEIPAFVFEFVDSVVRMVEHIVKTIWSGLCYIGRGLRDFFCY